MNQRSQRHNGVWRFKAVGFELLAAIAFYTRIPIPVRRTLEFAHISRYVVLVGLLIGLLLVGISVGLSAVGVPNLTRCGLLVVAWIGLTGGLHLDGAMDTADGLSVTDPQRRLDVMSDSRSGAFGVMAAIALMLLKTAALAEARHPLWLMLPLAAGWGRWAQQVAIARYPYLKAMGKGSFHKAALPSIWYTVPSLLLLLALCTLPLLHGSQLWLTSLGLALSGGAIALLVPAWFHHQLGGHTGDTYGAVVEWTETLFLVAATAL
ncbi:adenosylcobinamide-GDP ribazoletransferase [Leptolyngbya sp. AN02str]|uniref:adenosylcobinamide-GDP ribazoletransferase n=1 Tax=Leptolyngbya sp. AN02str TaxID=3423363 RepID=UPI003D31F35C